MVQQTPSPGYNSKAALGKRGEDAALAFIAARGWVIKARNWRPHGVYQGFELDIVAQDKNELVFVEVKTRSNGRAIPVHTAFGKRKQRTVMEAARRYLAETQLWELPCRFDLICLTLEPDGEFYVQHYPHALECGQTMDSSHSSWQPW